MPTSHDTADLTPPRAAQPGSAWARQGQQALGATWAAGAAAAPLARTTGRTFFGAGAGVAAAGGARPTVDRLRAVESSQVRVLQPLN